MHGIVEPNDVDRKVFQKYLKKARTLAANTASGSFPGKW
jgi:hypothetical protein